MMPTVFEHHAFEAYQDLLLGLRALLPLVVDGQTEALTSRFVELHREAHARYNRPYAVAADEAERVRSSIEAFGVVDFALPEVVAYGRWHFLVRSIARLQRVRELAGPVDLFRDDFLRGARDLKAKPYAPPSEIGWARVSDFIAVAIAIAKTTGDDVGIGSAINETPEARAFSALYPGAYSFWDVHGQPSPDEDPDCPEPLRYPGTIWSAAAIALAAPFADAPVGTAGPATFQPRELLPGPQLHPALARACEEAAPRGHVVVGYVDVSP